MTDVKIIADPSIKKLAESYEDIRKGMKDFRSLFKTLQKDVIDGVQRNFDTRGGIETWASLAMATIARKGDSRPLVASGFLDSRVHSKRGYSVTRSRKSMRVRLAKGSPAYFFIVQYGSKSRGQPGRRFFFFNEKYEPKAIKDFTGFVNVLIQDAIRKAK